MRMVRPLMLVLGLLGTAAPLALLPQAAHAQAPAVFPGVGLIEIVPAGDVIGDGASPVTVHVVALDPAGAPLTGLKLKASASAGTVEGWTEVQAGVYAFRWTAPSVSVPTSVTLEVKGRTDSRVAIDRAYKVPVRPPAASGVSVVSNPPQLILGQDGEGSISFTLADAAGDVSPEDLFVNASAGEIQNLTHLGGGRFTARFVTPRVNFPQLAILTVSDLRDVERVYGAVAIPLLGKTDYPVQAQPGSSVVLRIGGREFGPVAAAPTGRAAVPIVVPPGVSVATKVEVVNGQTLEDDIDLRVPETRRIAMMPTHRSVPADGATEVPLRVAAFTPDGQPDGSATVSFTATGGTVSPARHLGNGIYEARFVPRFSNVPVTAKVTANLTGSSIQTDTMEVRLVPARPQVVTLKAQPESLSKDATALRVFAKVLGSNGQGLDRRELVLSVTGATVKGGVEDLRNGDYRVDFSATGDTNVDVIATVRSPVTGNPLKHVLLFPQTDAIMNDGTTATRITVVTVDEFGYPVPNVDVKLQIETGDGSVQPAVKTNDGGVGQVFYTSGRGAGLVRIRAKAGNRTGLTAMVQGPAAVRGASVPVSGTDRDMSLTQAWEGLVVPLRVPREGAASGVQGPSDMAGSQAAGTLTRLDVKSEPATAAAGGQVLLDIQAKDGQGLGVGGLSFDFIVSQGEAGAPKDLGGGRYQVPVRVPPTAVGELKVSVASGDVASFLRIPISGVATGATGWGETGEPLAGTPVGGTPVVPPSTDKESIDMTFTRVRAAFVTSSYTYEQRAFSPSGPLLPATVAVGGELGGAAAAPQGVEFAGRTFFLDYVGVDANLRFGQWALQAAEFEGNTVPDTLVSLHADAVGRYPFAVGDNYFWVGARLGYHGSDILYFTGTLDTQIVYKSLYVNGLGFGGEIGGEIGDLYVHGALSGRMVGVSEYFATAVDAHVGYDVTDDIFIDAGFGYVERQVMVVGETSGNELGQLSDSQVLGRIGVGLKF